MVSESIAQILRLEVPNTLEAFEWLKAELSLSFSLEGNSGIGLSFFNPAGENQIPYYIDSKGRTNIRDIPSGGHVQKELSILYKDSIGNNRNRWNKALFTVYPDGSIETQFIWDAKAHLNNEIDQVKTCLSGLAESIYEDIVFRILPKKRWTIAEVTIQITNGKISPDSQIILVEFSDSYLTNLDEFWQQKIIEIYLKTNEGNLRGHFPKWNTLVYKISQGVAFNEHRDLSFELRDSTIQ